MYEYAHKRFIPSMTSNGVGTEDESDRISSWLPRATRTNVQNIAVQCYDNAPRERVVTSRVPYTMELSVPGHHFICIGNPGQECPESVHRNTDPNDPWRHRQCAAWRETWERQAADIIASAEFRKQVTENILDAAGITGWRRWFTSPAEFVQVLDERERRERAIRIAAIIALAAGGGAIFFTYLKDRRAGMQRNIPNVGAAVAVGTGAVAAATVAAIAIKRLGERRERLALYATGRRANGEPVESEFRLAANSLGGLIGATIAPASNGQQILDAMEARPHINRITFFGHGTSTAFMIPGVAGIRVGSTALPAWISVDDLAIALGRKLRAGAIIGLAGCAAGSNPGQENDWNTAYNPGGELSFAAKLRDALARIPGIPDGIEIRTHTRTGHTTANPSAIVFRVRRDAIGTAGTPLVDDKWGAGTHSNNANNQHFAREFRAGAERRRSPADKWIVGEDWWESLTLPPAPVWASV